MNNSWIAVHEKVPDAHKPIVLRSKDDQYFTGSYLGGGMFEVVSGIELDDGDGVLRQSHAQIYQSFFTQWMRLDDS